MFYDHEYYSEFVTKPYQVCSLDRMGKCVTCETIQPVAFQIKTLLRIQVFATRKQRGLNVSRMKFPSDFACKWMKYSICIVFLSIYEHAS